MFENMRIRNIVLSVLALVVFFYAVLFARKILLGNAELVSLPAAPALTGQIAQTLGPGPDGALAAAGKDYSLSAKYFNDEGWAVVNIKPASNDFQGGFAVMKKNNGIYQVVIGPGTSIAFTQLSGLPADVSFYLLNTKAVYYPIPGQ